MINNENKEWGIYDIRTPIFNQTIPFVLIKCKDESKRFKDSFTSSLIRETSSIFTPSEISQIIEFCKKLKFDYGELDILKDLSDDKIYIIDANNTPWWCPPLPEIESEYAIKRLSNAFKKEFVTQNIFS